MSLFDHKDIEHEIDSTQYTSIKKGLMELVEEWCKMNSIKTYGVEYLDPAKVKDMKEIAMISMQYVWKMMGKKIPDRSRNDLDSDCKLIN